jgi:hypothetical protein
VPLTNIQVETHALVKLSLFGVPRHDGSQQSGRSRELVCLQRRNACFVERDGFNVSSTRDGDGQRRILRRAAVALMHERV